MLHSVIKIDRQTNECFSIAHNSFSVALSAVFALGLLMQEQFKKLKLPSVLLYKVTQW